jgi:hypothetical protein
MSHTDIPEADLDDYWTRNEAAAELGVDPRTVDRLANDRQLARYKLGSPDERAAATKNGQDKRPVRFSKAEVAELKRARTVPVLVRE